MKKITLILLIGLFLIPFLWGMSWAQGTITVTPSVLKIPKGMPSSETIFYNLTGLSTGTWNSGGGIFTANGTAIGSSAVPFSVNFTNVPVRLSETLNIPIAIIKRAERLNTSRIIYSRTFTYIPGAGAPVNINVQTEIIVTTEAGSDLRITRLQLYFENGRAEITVKKNQPDLKAYADIRYTGSGLLTAYWEVDGRLIENVNQHLVYGQGRTVTIVSPDIPPLPTFEPGTHTVRFIITDPAQSLPVPVAIYFVTAEQFRRVFPIRLLSPSDQAEVDYEPVTFSWEGRDKTSTYLIEFMEGKKEKPIFSAFAKKTEYTLPASVLKSLFASNRTYQWRVKGFDAENNVAGASSTFRFTFKEFPASSYLPGQIVVVTADSQDGVELIEQIRGKYNLLPLESFVVKSLQLKVTIFQTKQETLELIGSIKGESGVVLAQPNYIFSTMAEPMTDMQKNFFQTLNLNRLHEKYRGKGVVVAVIDTGVDLEHQDLKDSIVFSKNLINSNPYKAEIHGTAVAGVVSADLNGLGIAGVAPEAKLLALRGCRQISAANPEGQCYTSSLVKALDTAIANRAQVVNMSFGAPALDKLIVKLLDYGANQGILFTAPVGNRPEQKDLVFPASHPEVIGVGGIEEGGKPYPNSEIFQKAAVCAPCDHVFTTIPGDKYNFVSGTSISSATVAGLLALAIEKTGSFNRAEVPKFTGDINEWIGDLFKISLPSK